MSGVSAQFFPSASSRADKEHRGRQRARTQRESEFFQRLDEKKGRARLPGVVLPADLQRPSLFRRGAADTTAAADAAMAVAGDTPSGKETPTVGFAPGVDGKGQAAQPPPQPGTGFDDCTVCVERLLDTDAEEDILRELFSQFGTVLCVRAIPCAPLAAAQGSATNLTTRTGSYRARARARVAFDMYRSWALVSFAGAEGARLAAMAELSLSNSQLGVKKLDVGGLETNYSGARAVIRGARKQHAIRAMARQIKRRRNLTKSPHLLALLRDAKAHALEEGEQEHAPPSSCHCLQRLHDALVMRAAHARPAQHPFRVWVCAARTLNAAGQPRVTLQQLW